NLVYIHLNLYIFFFSVHAMEGEALVVKCPRRYPDRTVKWYHTQTNQLIPAEEGARIHSSGRFLWFLPTSKEDSGNYTCSTVSLMVYPYKQEVCFPAQIRYPNDTGTLTSGRIVCPTIDNYENATIVKWHKDCKPLQEQSEKYLMKEKYLFMKRPQKTDEGYYTCHFTYTHSGNVYNVSATRPFIVDEESSVPVSVKILYPSDVIQVELGICRALLGTGKQNIAVVTWEVNKTKAENLNSSRFREDRQYFMGPDRAYYGEASLNIEEVKEEDLLSFFTCIALNQMEYVMIRVTLQLKVPYGKIYDAYVIYPKNRTNEANFVEYFVHQILPEVLENKHGYKLCIYGRDILPGEDAANALERRIQKSRRLIIILTPLLIQCEEYAYEHQIALFSALIQNNIQVILLEMEAIGGYEKLQESLRHIIKQQGTIKWKEKYTECPHASNSKFWKHVRYHMPLRHKSSQLQQAV
uniref:Interleukin 1 receptor like 1 n=1 Tax=Pelusios castaneus TaxID=367368 RepID=A0A8C8SIV2_9SAUR